MNTSKLVTMLSAMIVFGVIGIALSGLLEHHTTIITGNEVSSPVVNATNKSVSDIWKNQKGEEVANVSGTYANFSKPTNFNDNLTFRNAQIQAAVSGKIVPVGEGLGLNDAIDPATTDTPIQDCIDKGAICLLPPGTINESGTITMDRRTGIVGWGAGYYGAISDIQITKKDVNGINITGWDDSVVLDGFRIYPNVTTSDGVGIWQDGNTMNLKLGTYKGVAVGTKSGTPAPRVWNRGVEFGKDTGLMFQSSIGNLRVIANTSTSDVIANLHSGPENTIDVLSVSDLGDVNASIAVLIGSGTSSASYSINRINIGAGAYTGVRFYELNNAITVDEINFEPRGSFTNGTNAIKVGNSGRVVVHKLMISNVNVDNSVYLYDSPGNIKIDSISHSSGGTSDYCARIKSGDSFAGPVELPCKLSNIKFETGTDTFGWLKTKGSGYIAKHRWGEQDIASGLETEGMQLWNAAPNEFIVYNGTDWVVH